MKIAAHALDWAVYTAIHAVDVVATTAIADGHRAGVALARVSHALAALPSSAPPSRAISAPFRASPPMTATGYQDLHAIGHLAVLGVGFVAAVPLLILARTYLPRRLRAPRS